MITSQIALSFYSIIALAYFGAAAIIWVKLKARRVARGR